MSPIGALAIFTYAMLALAVVGVLALFIVKNPAHATVVFLVVSVFCIMTGIFAFTAQPSNYLGNQTIALLASSLVLVALLLRFVLKKSVFVAKLLLCCSLMVSITVLFLI
ncbi:MAG: hypothetical protein RR075_01665 [Pygmaiobacter sp.]